MPRLVNTVACKSRLLLRLRRNPGSFLRIASCDFLVKHICIFLFGEEDANPALLEKSVCLSHYSLVKRQTHVASERVEEWPVLVVLELSIKLVLPYDTPRASEINQLQDEHVLRPVIRECQCSLQSVACPFVTLSLRMRKADAGMHRSKDLVGRGWNCRDDFCLLFRG